MAKRISSGGNRKKGRNLHKCSIYRIAKKREKSHIRRITKHIKYNPNDRQAHLALIRYEKLL